MTESHGGALGLEWGCHLILEGEYYEQGFGCEANKETALGWYRRAADSSSVRGMMAYARCLTTGMGGPPAPQLALLQYRKAAALGHTAAQV
jgi:TPR repeat protein